MRVFLLELGLHRVAVFHTVDGPSRIARLEVRWSKLFFLEELECFANERPEGESRFCYLNLALNGGEVVDMTERFNMVFVNGAVEDDFVEALFKCLNAK